MAHNVVVAEWSRRHTRNMLGYSRAGSNPGDYDVKSFAFFVLSFVFWRDVRNEFHPTFEVKKFNNQKT